MTSAIVSTNTIAGVTPGTGECLTVRTVAPSTTVDGTNGTGQSVTIAGQVEMFYIWLGGGNTVNITQSGSFYRHGAGTNIYVGVDSVAKTTGGNVLNNAA